MLNSIHKSIRSSFLVFCCVFMLSIAAVATSYAYLEIVGDDEIKIKNEMRSWKNKISLAKENNQIIVENEASYLQLIDDGIVGEEDRLNWFETLQTIASSRGLDVFRYSTSSQVKLDKKQRGKKYRNIDVYKSVMQLTMSIAHEGDLFTVFSDLDVSAKGLYSIDSCSINKSSANDVELGLKVNCKLNWYTFKQKKVKG